MEKERKIKALSLVALIVAVLGLTIAFAALSQTLSINGSAYLDAAKWGIKFQNLSEPIKLGDANVIGEASIESDVSINNMNAKLTTPGDSVKYTVELVNEGTINAKIEKIEKAALTSEQQRYLAFTVKDEDGNEITEGDILNAGEVKTITVKIEFKKDIEKEDLPSETSTINLSYKLNFVQTDLSGTSSEGSGNGGSYEAEVKSWDLSSTVKMTYYNGEEQSDGTYKGGTLVISGTGDIPGFESDYVGGSLAKTIVGFLTDATSFEDINFDENQNVIYKYKPSNLIIEEDITHIGDMAFSGIPVTSVKIPNTVTSIGDNAFSESLIVSVRIPYSVKTMGYGVFQGCSNLKEIYFPSGVLLPDQEAVFGSSNGPLAQGSIIYVPDEETKNSLREGTCSTCSYDSEWTTIVVDPTKFN